MTSADDHIHVADAIDDLPPDIRSQLALGPLPEPDCRVCTVLKAGCLTDTTEIILDFHELGVHGFAEAAHGALGTDRRLTRDEVRAGISYKRKLEQRPVTNVARVAVEDLAGNLMWWRCLYIYLLAGWRP